MATIAEMRLYLMGQYPESMFWHTKVQKMPTRQVVAIYRKMYGKSREGLEREADSNTYHQIDMFEYLASLNQTRTEVKV